MAIQNVKPQYTQKEWESREQYYIDKCSKINIPQQVDGRMIMSFTSIIDDLLSEALIEQAYMKKTLGSLKNKLMLAEKEMHLAIKERNFKENGLDGIPSNKVTSDDIKSHITQYLKYTPLDNMPDNIYNIVFKAEARCTFIDAIVRVLSEKKSALIADNAILKLESSIRQ